MPDTQEIAMPLGGMFSAGDPERIPDGMCRLAENVVFRPGRIEKRPPFIYESVVDGRGFANWHDAANKVERLARFGEGGGASVQIFLKSQTGSETYGAAVTGFAATAGQWYVADYCNYRGKLYFSLTNGGTPTTVPGSIPEALGSFDGATITQYPLGGDTLFAFTVKPFVDRLILGNVVSSVQNRLGTTNAYDSTAWAQVTTTRTNITNGSAITSRITPTGTTNSQIYLVDQYTIAAATTDTTLIFRSDLRNTSPTYEMPLTLEIYYSQIWVTLTAYSVGAIRVPTTATGNGFKYRVTVAGTAAVGEPIWPTTVGTTVVDGTVTWICDGPDALGSLPATLPTISEESEFLPYFVRGVHQPSPASSKVGVRLKFGTAAVGTITLVPIDISLRDGVTDGDLTKRCFGQQLTTGKFIYPFFNQQSSATATIALDNDLYYTETSDPNTILGASFQRLSDLPGRVTASAVVGGRYVAFKRQGMWVFQGGTDPNIPLIRERFFANVGCLGPRAWCVFEDVLYFACDYEVYRWTPGGVPEPLCGDAIREELYTKATFIETKEAANPAMSLVAGLTVDEKNRDLIVSLQKGFWHCMDLDTGRWSRFSEAAYTTAVLGPSLHCPTWNSLTKHIYYGIAVSRYDDSSTAESTFSGLTSVTSTVTLRPLPRSEIGLDKIWISHMATGDQSSSTLAASVSFDVGATFTKTNTVRVPVVAANVSGRFPIAIRQSGPRLVVKLAHLGNAGGASFTLTGVDAVTRVLRETERPRSNPVAVSSNL